MSCGFPIAACEVKILDDNDQEVKTGDAGEICVRAPHVRTRRSRSSSSSNCR